MKALFYRSALSLCRPLNLLILLMFAAETVAVTCVPNIATIESPFDLMMFGAMMCLISSILPQSVIGEDEQSGWNRYCLTMPVKRSQYISEKYLFTLIFIIFFALLASLGVIILLVRTTGFDIKEYFLVLSGMMSGAVVMMSLELPLIFRFGTKKGVLLFTASFLVVIIGVLSLIFWVVSDGTGQQFLKWLQETDHLILALCILSANAVIYTVSWLLSIRLYQKREL